MGQVHGRDSHCSNIDKITLLMDQRATAWLSGTSGWFVVVVFLVGFSHFKGDNSLHHAKMTPFALPIETFYFFLSFWLSSFLSSPCPFCACPNNICHVVCKPNLSKLTENYWSLQGNWKIRGSTAESESANIFEVIHSEQYSSQHFITTFLNCFLSVHYQTLYPIPLL